jgi:predicted  nucleic acid-binding Zn-ribbon protein
MQLQSENEALMSTSPFTAFTELVTLDQNIRCYHDEIAQKKSSIQDDMIQQQEITNRLEQFKQHVKELRKMINSYELEIKDLDAKEKRKRELLDKSSSMKEYQPLKREIDSLKQMQNDIEAQLMSVWNKLDLAQKELEEQEKIFNSKKETLLTNIEEKQQKIADLQKQLNSMIAERPQKEVGIPNEWLQKYTHMRMHVADPVIEVLNGACGACFYTITDQELLRLKRKALVQCKGCFRLMFMAEVMKQEVSQAQESNVAK